ncbi:MAG: hypothetical protein ABI599_18660 [Flavobacteriales bacterium]
MKERHPIDDLFREGLYASEAEPPAEVWQRVVAQRSWGHRVLAGLQRRWAIALLVVALVGTPLAWYAAQGEDPALASATGQPAQNGPVPSDLTPTTTEGAANSIAPTTMAEIVHDTIPDPAPANTTDIDASESKAVEGDPKGEAPSPPQRTKRPTTSSATTLGVGVETKNNGPVDQGKPSPAGSAQGSGAEGRTTGSSLLPTDDVGRTAPEAPTTNAAVQVSYRNDPLYSSVAVEVGSEDYVNEEFLLAHSRPIAYSHFPDSLLTSERILDAPYVLANGAWWVGVQFGWDQLGGGWSGTSPLVDELNKAEDWQSALQAGIVGGRTWKSGLSLSLGVGVADVKSRFLFKERVPQGNGDGFTSVLDTTWQANAVAPDSSYTVYTYSIDYILIPIGETEVQYNATNRHTLLNIPLELAWQKNLKRFTLAPRIGVNANIFLARNGNTLITNASDGRTTSMSANDPRADSRYGILLSGSAGVDVGYALDERTQIFAGGAYSSVLTSLANSDLRPAMQGVRLRLRIVREFGMKQRKHEL